MGTISDKLMRIINTKEDIRQALISKGYDVPTSIPFKEYAKMISDLPCKVDDFPKLPGDVTRWYFGGLTNEMMAAMDDPRIEDADHKGRFLSFKNFAWGEMSGVGGYTQNYNNSAWRLALDRAETTKTGHSFNVTSVTSTAVAFYYQSGSGQEPFTVKSQIVRVSGLTDGQSIKYGTGAKSVLVIESDGIYTLPPFDFAAKGIWYGFSFGKIQESCNITVEQLPLYSGALVFDGVDDYGICDNFPILTKEKGYTVVALRQIISTKASSVVSKFNASNDGAFLFEGYTLAGKHISGSFGTFVHDIEKSPFSYMTSVSYNGTSINPGNKLDKSNTLAVGTFYNDVFNRYFGNIALWELIILDHDATEEELTKIKNYFIKTYPWLFFDQAWTVVGKTNEDEDRATIANITGNGNDLVLSNFGFAEGSGYGLYADNYNNWRVLDTFVNATKNDHKIEVTQVINIAIQIRHDLPGDQDGLQVSSYKVKITGITENQTINYRSSSGISYIIDQDGIYTLPEIEIAASGWYGFQFNKVQESCNITIEQIPEYEGYLVTDGVDDKIVSSVFGMGKDFTIVGDWKFIDNKKSGTGLVKASSFYIYNTTIGLDLYINSGSVKNSLDGIKSINAACSDGRAYDRNWNEILANTGNVVGSGGTLEVSSSGGRFDRIAFKNLVIYPRILSKDDCIKAYNYLQTLKSK